MPNTIISELICLFSIIIIGIIMKKNKIIDEHIEYGFSEFVMNISLPSLLIVSLYDTRIEINFDELIKIAALVFAIYFVVVCFAIGVSKFISSKIELRKSISFLIIFGNVTNMGYPIVMTAYGSIGVLYATIFNLIFSIVLWTVGIWILNDNIKKFNIKNMLNPGMCGIIIGYAVYFLKIPLPTFLYLTLSKLGATLSPIAMIIIGATLAEQNFRNIATDKIIWKLTFIKHILLPIILFFILHCFIKDNSIIGICIVMMSMPSAVNSISFMKKYNGNHVLAAKAITVTSVVSMLILPLMLRLLAI